MGNKEHIAVRVYVYTRRFGVLSFGLSEHGFSAGEVFQTGEGATDLISVGWSRSIGRDTSGSQAGQMAFALPGRYDGLVGLPWGEVISPNDTVELQVKVERSLDEDVYNQDWWTEFVGEVRSVQLENDDSVVLCQDGMGRLSYEHFSYWRSLGSFMGSDESAIRAKMSEAHMGVGETNLMSNSIAGAAQIIFKAIIYDKLNTTCMWEEDAVPWQKLHNYRFESDNQGVTIDLASLAPEGSSWGDALSWAVDSPEWYEFFMDNVPEDELKKQLHNNGSTAAGASVASQIQRKTDGKVFEGERIERFLLRPAPFPTYDPEADKYNSTAWDGLPTTVAWPWGVININTTRNRDHIYSVYSADGVNNSTQSTGDGSEPEAQAQVVIDVERFRNHVGYRPLDARTKRLSSSFNTDKSMSSVEFARMLSWQLFSFHHFNDRFYNGVIVSSFDWRPRLGERYIAEGYLYYVEGYQHTIDAHGAESQFTVTRGLTLPQYGVKMSGPAIHMLGRAAESKQWQEEWNLFPSSLGRKRPGEEFAPVLQDVIDTQAAQVIGSHDDSTPSPNPTPTPPASPTSSEPTDRTVRATAD